MKVSELIGKLQGLADERLEKIYNGYVEYLNFASVTIYKRSNGYQVWVNVHEQEEERPIWSLHVDGHTYFEDDTLIRALQTFIAYLSDDNNEVHLSRRNGNPANAKGSKKIPMP